MKIITVVKKIVLLIFMTLATVSIGNQFVTKDKDFNPISNKDKIKFLVQDNGRVEKIKRLRKNLKE